MTPVATELGHTVAIPIMSLCIRHVGIAIAFDVCLASVPILIETAAINAHGNTKTLVGIDCNRIVETTTVKPESRSSVHVPETRTGGLTHKNAVTRIAKASG